jgi:hypothetical protein
MSREHHYVDVETAEYQAFERGQKKFIITDSTAHDFKLYDMLYLVEVVKGVKTGRVSSPLEIQYILYASPDICTNCCVLNW